MRAFAFAVLAIVATTTLGACDSGRRGVDHDTTTIIHDDRTVVVPAPAQPDREPHDRGLPPPDRHDRPPPPDRGDPDRR